MDIKSRLKAADLLMKLAKGENDKASPKEYTPQKPQLPRLKKTRLPFRESIPESAGVKSSALRALYSELSAAGGVDPHTLIVLCNGRLVAKGAWAPYRFDCMHISHSMCKSVTSMAVGLAVSEGKLSLDEKIADIFSDKMPLIPPKGIKAVTIRHLLTMTAGIAFNEAGAICETDWIKCCLSSETIFEPGSDFNYNSLCSYLLSAAVFKRPASI